MALTVGRGLTAYIEVDERAATLSVVKNIFGRGTPMRELLHASDPAS